MPEFCQSCKAPVLWGMTPKGEKAPVDHEPVENGNTLLLRQSQLGVVAIVLSGKALTEARERGVALWINHYATCPDRADWRARTDARRGG